MKRDHRFSILFACVLIALLATSPTASQDEPARSMTLVDLISMPSLGSIELSADGTWAVYTLSEADWDENKRRSHIWRVDADGTSTQLTFGDNGESSPKISPDGRHIAFLTKRGDDERQQIYLLPTAGGEAKRLTTHATSPSRLQWSTTSEELLFLASEDKTKEEKAKDKLKDDVFAYDENFKHRHLWSVALDGSSKRITGGDYSLLSYELSRDASKIVLHRSISPLFDDSDEAEIWILDRASGESLQLTDNPNPERGGSLSPDGRWVVYTSGVDTSDTSYFNDNVFVVPAQGGTPRLLLEDMPHGASSARWSADGREIYFLGNTGIRTQLFSVDLEGEELTQLTRGDHSFRGWSYSPQADRHIVSLNTPNNPGDIARLEDAELAVWTRHFERLELRYRLPRQEPVTWVGADGTPVEGLLFYPLGYEKGKRYPLAVQTHGGPAASDKFGFGRWSSYPQVLAARGWLVFKPNYRGSTGYGDAFLRDMVGGYFRQAHLDVMTGVDHLIAEGLADPDRMIKMGWSAGGHMTNKIITHTDRFKAASSGAGAVNWISMYGQSDVRIYRTPWFGGTPWQKDAPIDVYWEHSPLKDIAKVTTPTLVLVGENDARVPPPQSIELFRALKSNGVPTHLYMAPREGHGWRELRHELFKCNVELEWFEKHALGREYEWEMAPGDEDEESEEEGADSAAESTGAGA